MAKSTITIRQSGSPIRRRSDQRATLVGLGLNRVGRERELEDTAAIRGMIAKVQHMIEVQDKQNWVKAEPWLLSNPMSKD